MSKPDYNGTWVEQRTEGKAFMLRSAGVPEDLVTQMCNFKVTHTYVQNGDDFVLTEKDFHGEEKYEFKADGSEKKFDKKIQEGSYKCKTYWDGDKLMTDCEEEDGNVFKISRIIKGDEMVLKVVRKETTATSYLKRQ